MAHLHRQAGSGTARKVVHRRLEPGNRWADQGLFRCGECGAHQRHAECFHAELGLPLLDVTPRPAEPVAAELGLGRNLPEAFGHALVVELRSEFVFLAAAEMFDLDRGRQVGMAWNAETGADRHARNVFHADRLAGAEQRAVEHRMDGQRRPAVGVVAQVEVPRLDALVPVRIRKRQVFAQARERHQRAPVVAAPRNILREGQPVACPGNAVRIGGAGKPGLARAVAHADLCFGHRPAAVERGDPDQRPFTAMFEVHGQVRDEHAGRHVIRLLRIVQCAPEAWACQLHDVKPGLRQWNADHLHRLVAAGARQFEGGGLVALPDGRNFALARIGAVLAAQPVEVLRVLVQEALQPLHDLRLVVGEAQRAAGNSGGRRQRDLLPGQRRLHIAYRHRQHRLGLEFEDTEAARKLDERRVLVGGRGQRERGHVLRFAAGIILEAARQFDGEPGLFRERAAELDAVHGLDVRLQHRFEGLPWFAFQPDARRRCARHRRVERQRDRCDRQTGRVLFDALASQVDHEIGPHPEREPLRCSARETGLRFHLGADHDRYLRTGRQPPRAFRAGHRQIAEAFVLDLQLADGDITAIREI
ncbi:MAG: hypothetical protein CAPSK01_001658 [Candidatus Accumulibacter vicinus]|uniref:Uncharacterized protein n=1 Tax=Candidatus Accumulibacter vicinus TaxID=2954382 RepID=A0A084Y259_9PROT|nr:MAG: hypothetical protein CAPSK01_001658 [Candidatus Accumulibacter vicinus]